MLKYGMKSDSELSIELHFIAKGAAPGMTLFDHFMEARRLAWPKRYRHEWTDLMYRNFIENDVTVLMGSASSQKTSHAVEFSLLNYWARPENTLVVLSTINMEKLDIGVWAELQMLWKGAKDIHPGLYGNILSHKRAITTDNLEDEEGLRDFRKGIICRPCYLSGRFVGLGILAGLKQDHLIYVVDECFPSGTMVDTILGQTPIENIRPGEIVINAAGAGVVSAVSSRMAHELVEVKSKDGRCFACTPNHPILTNKGWINAGQLNQEHYMLSPHEALRVLQGGVSREEGISEVLFSELSTEAHARIARSQVQTLTVQDQMVGVSGCLEIGYGEQNEVAQSNAQCRNLSQSGGVYPRFWVPTPSEGWEWYWTNQSGKTVDPHVSRGEMELPSSDRNETRKRLPDVLQVGYCVTGNKARNRGRWRNSQQPGSQGAGQKENGFSVGSWVDSVEVLEQTDPRFPHSSPDRIGCRVYNLQVKGHPSYSVSGICVHNCQFMAPAFSLSWPHLFANGNVKIIAAGNPKHDPYDELGKTAEPLGGWNSIPEPTKTTVWETKHMGAKCINLVGTDSPNFKLKPGQPEFPRLISPKFAKRIEHDNEAGVESFEYYRLVRGVMKVSFAASRVIDRPLCINHGAMEAPVWKGTRRTGIYALDPTYGGEDRCVGRPLWFGKADDNTEIIEIGPYKVFPLNVGMVASRSIEDQIADICQEELTKFGIDPSNLFFDATGKGTIGSAFGRKFGSNAPIAVDSGAMPTERPVRDGLFVTDDYGVQRPKTCREHYSKFVSEMWFSVRYAIEANQVRNLDEDTMMEGCARVYGMKNGKIEVEAKYDPKKKEDLKRRLGKSPDLFDCVAIGFEGARQRGFRIARLGQSVVSSSNEEWFDKEASEYQEAIQSRLLIHH